MKFQKCFPPGVIELETRESDQIAVVSNPRKDTASRECLRHPEFSEKVKLMRVRDHFIFTIESVGAVGPAELFERSVDVLIEKAKGLKKALKELS